MKLFSSKKTKREKKQNPIFGSFFLSDSSFFFSYLFSFFLSLFFALSFSFFEMSEETAKPTVTCDHEKIETELRSACELFMKLSDVDYEGHTLYKEDKSNKITIRYGSTEKETGVTMPYYISQGVLVGVDPKYAVRDLFYKNARRAEWDSTYRYGKVVETWTLSEESELRKYLASTAGEGKELDVTDVCVHFEGTKPMYWGMISARSFIFATVSWVRADGAYMLVQITPKEGVPKEIYPEECKDDVFGTMYLNGSLAKETEDKPEGKKAAEIRSLVQTSPGGSIPDSLASKAIGGELISFFTSTRKLNWE